MNLQSKKFIIFICLHTRHNDLLVLCAGGALMRVFLSRGQIKLPMKNDPASWREVFCVFPSVTTEDIYNTFRITQATHMEGGRNGVPYWERFVESCEGKTRKKNSRKKKKNLLNHFFYFQTRTIHSK